MLFGFTEGTGGYAVFGFKRGELNVQLIAKRIEGIYPNYHSVIPQPEEMKHRCWFQREELLNVMSIMADNTTEKDNSARMDLNKNQATFTAGPPDCRCSMNVAVNFKDTATIAFNPRYLLDTLKGLDVAEVAIELMDELSPLVVTTHAPDPFKAVIMPMRMS